MSYEPINRDFIEPNKSMFCSDTQRELTSRTAYYVKNTLTGEILQLSRECAINRLQNTKYSIKDFLDLTKFSFDENGKNYNPISRGIDRIRETDKKYLEKMKALEYLELRENKLIEFGTSHIKLKNYYLQSKKEELTEANINHILNIENIVQTDESQWKQNLSLSNLRKVYYLKSSLEYLIFKYKGAPSKISFFSSIMKHLSKKLEISEKQEECLKSYL